MQPAKARTGRSCWSACRRASDAKPSTASPRCRTTAPSTRGVASSPATGMRTSSALPGRARPGCSPRRGVWSRNVSSCSPDRSASSAAGGTATRRSATTSWRGSRPLRWRGSIAKTATGTCMAFLPDYAELHCLSNFTFLRGASHPEELVERAKALGYRALALTDECSFAGAVRAHLAAKEARLQLILGTELVLEDGLKLVLLATDRASYGALCSLITTGRRRGKKGSYTLTRADVQGLAKSGVLALWVPGEDLSPARWLAEHFAGSVWIAVELHCGPNDRARLNRLISLRKEHQLPLVAAGDVHMHVRSRRRLQDVLTAVRLKRTVAECGQALFPNAERSLRLRVRLAQLYPAALLAESVAIAE